MGRTHRSIVLLLSDSSERKKRAWVIISSRVNFMIICSLQVDQWNLINIFILKTSFFLWFGDIIRCCMFVRKVVKSIISFTFRFNFFYDCFPNFLFLFFIRFLDFFITTFTFLQQYVSLFYYYYLKTNCHVRPIRFWFLSFRKWSIITAMCDKIRIWFGINQYRWLLYETCWPN